MFWMRHPKAGVANHPGCGISGNVRMIFKLLTGICNPAGLRGRQSGALAGLNCIQPAFIFRWLCNHGPGIPAPLKRTLGDVEVRMVLCNDLSRLQGRSAHPGRVFFSREASLREGSKYLSETTCDATPLARRLYKNQIVGTYPRRHAVWRVR